jgi:hypothetical protein
MSVPTDPNGRCGATTMRYQGNKVISAQIDIWSQQDLVQP